MPSEQPRYPEPLRRDVRGYPWCVECGDRTVLQPRCPDCLPAQPQPRGEGDAGKTRGYTREDIQANTWWPGKGGEGDDLAARLEREADCETPPSSEWWNGQLEALLREAVARLRASTHPEQSARVELLETALLPFALAHEQRDDDSTVGGPPVAVQVGGQTHGDDPWEVAARVVAALEGSNQ